MTERCLLCEGEFAAGAISVREMMFGTREEFAYLRCSRCGSLCRRDTPDDIRRFYPDDYYSLGRPAAIVDPRPTRWVKQLRTATLLRLPPRSIDRLVSDERIPGFFRWLAGLRVSRRSAVCDVGSGSGQALFDMKRQGFTRLIGVDPYIDRAESVEGITLLKCEISDVNRRFDVLLLNHAFEHVPEPIPTLEALRARLATAHSAIVIRVPVADSWAASHYGADWVQLDAPRHVTVPTVSGIAQAAARVGLRIRRTFYDSDAIQFWGSELYRRGIPLRSGAVPEDQFSAVELASWGDEAQRLNAFERGDSAGFVLSRMWRGPSDETRFSHGEVANDSGT